MASSPTPAVGSSVVPTTLPSHCPAEAPQPSSGVRPARLRAQMRWLWLLLVGIQLRLRFLLLVAVFGLLMHQWPSLSRYLDLVLSHLGADDRRGAVSPDTEYFCPMDPGVLSTWPGKCSICNMALVRRKRGDAVLLPSGVVARMQFSPYRVQLAGIHTTPAVFMPLQLEHTFLGRVVATLHAPPEASPPFRGSGLPAQYGAAACDGVNVACPVWETERGWLRVGDSVQIVCDHLPGQPATEGQWTGPLAADNSLWGVYLAHPPQGLVPGMLVSVRAARAVAELPPFDNQPRPIPNLVPDEPRQLFTCAEHPHLLRAQPQLCPLDGERLHARRLRPSERVRWWCPIHRDLRATSAGQCCHHCGAPLAPRIERFVPAGCVLCVPESAVIDTGEERVVYVERHAGMFDAVVVEAGPPLGGWVPIFSGVYEGDRVATAGAFLVDAEARLNPSLAASYFGATGTRRSEEGRSTGVHTAISRAVLADLAPADAESVARQRICPVTGLSLGSMGKPLAVDVLGVRVWICCAGCAGALKKHPHEHMARLP